MLILLLVVLLESVLKLYISRKLALLFVDDHQNKSNHYPLRRNILLAAFGELCS